ncbi:IclR family transcriptional regulator [Nonomuraea roseola]|uniref:IclR family transcriptional regulator n=1 Tax=Nonomuraea roseola TaxID=46179 RepID=A0ABV5QED1_9ACTN
MPPPSVAGKVMAILDAFSHGEMRLTLTEICRRADLPLATGHRLVGELTRGGFVERMPDGAYRVGIRLWRIGAQAAAAADLRELALPYMEDLYEVTHANVQLAVRRGLKALYLERLRGPSSVPIVSRVGGELPLHATGVGRVLLAFAPEQVTDEVVSSGLPALTRHTVTDPVRLRAALAEVRRTGVAVTREEMTLGTCSVAAPVRGAGGEVIAALSIVTRPRADLRAVVPTLITTARALSRDVSGHY